MMAKVVIQHGESKELGRIFRVSQPTIRRALNGETNTPLAKKIRTAAIKRGGVVMVAKKTVITNKSQNNESSLSSR